MKKVLGDLELVRRLGVGGMAEVYLARELKPGNVESWVAVKRILPQYCRNIDFVKVFAREAKIASKLKHPNIVRVHDFRRSKSGDYFLVLEYVRGTSLAHLLRLAKKVKKPFPEAALLEVLRQTLKALHYVHTLTRSDGQAMELVHRDISPDNILISDRGEIKLADFGIARVVSPGIKTIGGDLIGKIGYLAPEQARGERVDARSDLYALGLLAYEMCTLKRLYSTNTMEALQEIREGKSIPHRSDAKVSHISDSTWASLQGVTQADPNARIESAQAWLQTLTLDPNRKNQHPNPLTSWASALLTGDFDATRRDPESAAFMAALTGASPAESLEGEPLNVPVLSKEGVQDTLIASAAKNAHEDSSPTQDMSIDELSALLDESKKHSETGVLAPKIPLPAAGPIGSAQTIEATPPQHPQETSNLAEGPHTMDLNTALALSPADGVSRVNEGAGGVAERQQDEEAIVLPTLAQPFVELPPDANKREDAEERAEVHETPANVSLSEPQSKRAPPVLADNAPEMVPETAWRMPELSIQAKATPLAPSPVIAEVAPPAHEFDVLATDLSHQAVALASTGEAKIDSSETIESLPERGALPMTKAQANARRSAAAVPSHTMVVAEEAMKAADLLLAPEQILDGNDESASARALGSGLPEGTRSKATSKVDRDKVKQVMAAQKAKGNPGERSRNTLKEKSGLLSRFTHQKEPTRIRELLSQSRVEGDWRSLPSDPLPRLHLERAGDLCVESEAKGLDQRAYALRGAWEVADPSVIFVEREGLGRVGMRRATILPRNVLLWCLTALALYGGYSYASVIMKGVKSLWS